MGGVFRALRLALNGDTTYAIRQDGSIVGWGRNNSGQATTPTGLAGVKQVVATGDFTIALYESAEPACASDLDGSGSVDSADIGLLLLDFGACN
ncbi:MAG: hypothetical protein FJ292_09890 [Planctomycetes bacterium]|nr:hypothetical protein [Planctomycetota bacterium]